MWAAFSFFADHISILHGIGALTAVGGIAAYFLVPGVAPVVTIVLNALSALLSTRIGCAVLAGAVCGYLCALEATHKADLACAAKINALVAQSITEASDRDKAIAANLEATYGPVELGLDKQSADLQTVVNAYVSKLKSAPACQLGADAVRRLRH